MMMMMMIDEKVYNTKTPEQVVNLWSNATCTKQSLAGIISQVNKSKMGTAGSLESSRQSSGDKDNNCLLGSWSVGVVRCTAAAAASPITPRGRPSALLMSIPGSTCPFSVT